MAFCLSLLLLTAMAGWGGVGVRAQNAGDDGKNVARDDGDDQSDNATERETGQEPQDGHDRPTTYPRLRFGADKPERVKTPSGRSVEVRTRVYLLDTGAAMGEVAREVAHTETPEAEKGEEGGTEGEIVELTRLDLARAELERVLDGLSDRRNLRFSLAVVGDGEACTGEDEPFLPGEETLRKAREWLKELAAGEDGDLHGTLAACFEEEPSSISLLVGGMPASPRGVAEAEVLEYGDVQEFLIAKVKEWRSGGRKTTLDVTGVALSEEARKFYRRLAEAGGGVYLDL